MCVINKFNRYVFRKFDLQITDCLTVARLSLNVFLKHYLGESKLPLITKKQVYSILLNKDILEVLQKCTNHYVKKDLIMMLIHCIL